MLIDIFENIFKMSITATVVILILLIIRYCLKSSPKIYSYMLWSVVLFRLLVPFNIESNFSLLPNSSIVEKNIVFDRNEVSADVTDNESNVENNKNNSNIINQSDSIEGNLNTNTQSTNNFQNSEEESLTYDQSLDTKNNNFLNSITQVASIIWVIGFVVLVSKNVMDLQKLKVTLSSATIYKNNIYISENTPTAFVLGIIKPKIYLPIGLDENAINYIVKHEEIHIKRKDTVFRFLGFIALSIHWFNPFVWIAYSKSGEDMEMSCDERVIKELGNEIKKDYSRSLLALATDGSMLKAIPLAFAENDTKSRIQNVLNYNKPKFWLVAVSIAIVIITSITLLTSPKGSTTITDVGLSEISNIENISSIQVKIFDEKVSGNRDVFTINSDKIEDVYNYLEELEVKYTNEEQKNSYQYLVEIKYVTEDSVELNMKSFGFSEDFKYIFIYDNFETTGVYEVVYPEDVKNYLEELQNEELSTRVLETTTQSLGSDYDVLWYTREEFDGDIEKFNRERAWILPLYQYTTKSSFEEEVVNDTNWLQWNIETEEDYINTPELYQSARYIFLIMPEIDELRISAVNKVYGYENSFGFRREKFELIYGDTERASSGDREEFNTLIDEILTTDYFITDVYEKVIYNGEEVEMRTSYPLSSFGSNQSSGITAYPRDFTPNIAKASNNFVVTNSEVLGREWFDSFLSNVENGEGHHLYETMYTKEGDAITYDIMYDGVEFKVFIDARRDEFGLEKITQGTYKNLVEYVKSDNGNKVKYYLTDKETINDEDFKNGFDGILLYSE